MKHSFLLWVAQGFGAGRIPVAPGTFGSLVGLLWLLLLLRGSSLGLLLGGMIGMAALSIWICDRAERILKQKDPGSIVLDEITALPICFSGWLGWYWQAHRSLPVPDYFFQNRIWPLTAAVFLTFRFFDIVKPWPVRASQRLPGGWGVTVDDLLAAAYVNLITLAGFMFVGFKP